MSEKYQDIQSKICKKYNTQFLSSPPEKKIGISFSNNDTWPINGLRHLPQGDTTGWYIWRGVYLSEEEEFFKPLHVMHLDQLCPEIQKFLGLPPGWRFLIAENYEDVWFDISLLDV